jgi:uncharacterized phage infection (PIP) family protein YhgE
MKVLDIAFKDIKRALRNGFGIVMMFIVPIMVPAIVYAAFGGALSGSADGSGFNMSVTRVVVVNLDQGGDQAAGAILTEFLQGEDLKTLLETTVVDDEATARDQVNNQQADVAVIIPADFSQAAAQPTSCCITIRR